MTDSMLLRTVRVKDVSYANREPDQFCTVGEFIAYNFLDEEDPAAEIAKFKAVLERDEVYRLDVGLGCGYAVCLAD